MKEFEATDCVLWVDVEGANEVVLKGARSALARTSAVFIEVEDKRLWDSQWLSDDVANYLYDLGLRPVARDYQSTHQYNLMFVRNSLQGTDASQRGHEPISGPRC